MNRRTKSTMLVILGCVVSLILISYQFKEEPTAKTEDTTPQAETENDDVGIKLKRDDLKLVQVKQAHKAIEQPISGRVVPKNTTQVFSEVQGKVLPQGFKLKAGITFKAGESLINLDSKEFELQLEAQRSAFLNILTGMMPDLKSDYPDNYPNWLNYIQHYQSGSNLEKLPDTKSAGEKYFVTSNQVYSTYYNIKSLEERLTKFKIVAPYSGSVTEALADKGSLISPGQLLGTIINNKNFELEAAAGLEVVAKLQIGDQINFVSNELEGQWIGTVIRINDLIDTKTQNIPVYFDIHGPNLKAGMYLEGSFVSNAYQNVFTIPTAMLTRDEKVLLLEKNTIKGKPVELVEFMQDSILVRGLSNDDLLIANRFSVPVEGMKISL